MTVGTSVRRTLVATAGVLALLPAVRHVHAQAELETLPVQGNVFMLAGDRSNTTIQIGADGAFVVDTQRAELSERVLAAVRRLTPKPIRHVVVTSADPQHAGGAAALSKAGRYVRVIDSIDPRGLDARASIIAHLNVLNRMSAGNEPAASWPTDTYFTPQWSLFSNGEGVQLVHVPAAHTDGDTIVFFRRSDVVSTGAIFDAGGYPRFDPKNGGSVDGVVEGLDTVLDLAIPGENQEGGTVIVPGHGRLADETDVANYRDMVVIVRDRVRDMVKKGMTLEQVTRNRPTADYDGVYGGSREWPPERFVEAVFQSVSTTPGPAGPRSRGAAR
jgi:glyoxylase-like metal-dependent hydrolase (beta-lactamase superfamily II)